MYGIMTIKSFGLGLFFCKASVIYFYFMRASNKALYFHGKYYYAVGF